MKFKTIIFLVFLITACTPQLTTLNKKDSYSATGFAYVYNDKDFNEKIIQGKMNNEKFQISHQNLKTGTLLKISNPKNNESLILKNIKRIRYPDFYKVLITKAAAEKLDLDINLPILEIIEVKKNKSFIAEEAKMFKEEKNISSKAPVASVQISNISKKAKRKKIKKTDHVYILLGSFYSIDTAKFLKERINKDIQDFDINKLKIQKKNNKKTLVISGPYSSINSLKNDYIKLKAFGFEDLDIFLNE